MKCGPGSSVGTATDYGLDSPGIKSRWRRDFPPLQTGPGDHQASCTMGTGSCPGVKRSRGVLLTIHPLLVPRSLKIELYLYSPLGHNWACDGVTVYQREVSANKVTHLSCCLENSCNNFLIKCGHFVDITVIIISIYCYLTKYRIPSVQKSAQEYKAQAKEQYILMQTYNSFKFSFVDEMAIRCL